MLSSAARRPDGRRDLATLLHESSGLVDSAGMSLTQEVELATESLPSCRELQAAIEALGFELRLDLDSVLTPSTESLACVLEGQQLALQTYLDEAGSKSKLSFVWGSDELELECVTVLSAVLATAFGAVVTFEGEAQSSARLVEDAKSLASARRAASKRDNKARRTPANWRSEVSSLIAELHADYALNQVLRLPQIEFVRRHDRGPFVSYSFDRKNRCWTLSLALLFEDPEVLPDSVPVMQAGQRFGRGLDDQVFRDLGASRRDDDALAGLWSSSEWYDNTLPLLERGLQVAEGVLVPRYLDLLAAGRDHLLAVLDRADELAALLRDRLDDADAPEPSPNVVELAPSFASEAFVRRLSAAQARGLDAAAIVEGLHDLGRGFSATRIAKGDFEGRLDTVLLFAFDEFGDQKRRARYRAAVERLR